MRQKAFACAGFALLLGILAFPVLAQSRSINYETYIVDSFDGSEDTDWSWTAAGSKFITDGYPVVKYFDGMPNAMRVMQTDEDGNYQVLGIQFKFNRQGDNWVDIIPMAAAEGGEGDEEGGGGESPYEIPFRGVVSRIDMWVWGAGYYYQLEVLLRDCYGRVHALPMGTLNYEGWRNLSVNVPTNLPQTSRYLGDEHNMRFVAFRIRTSPTERVDDFYVFFDQLKVLTDTYSPSYDGFEFAGADFSDDSGSDSGSGENAETQPAPAEEEEAGI